MHLPEPATHALGWLAYEFTRIQPLIPTYTHLVLSAIFPIYVGAHSSLSRPSSAAKPNKSERRGTGHDDEDDDDNEGRQKMEGLSPSDAIIFPILAGTTLAGLYFLIKWLQDPELLNRILNWYFAGFSIFSVARLLSDGLDVIHSLLFPHDFADRGILFHVDAKRKMAISTVDGQQRRSPLPGALSRLPVNETTLRILWFLHILPSRRLWTLKANVRHVTKLKLSLGIHGTEGLIIGVLVVAYFNFVSKPWWLTNLMGFGFAYGALQIMSPTTFWTGTLILCALFLYDIYFVFFTPLMVTVAKSLDVPIKLVFPRPAEPGADPLKQSLSMLGLGDVVLPGIIIGLALRFDLFMFYLKKQTTVPSGKGDITENRLKNSSYRTQEDTLCNPKSPHGNVEDTASPNSMPHVEHDTSDRADYKLVKAPYISVAEGWGDRLWTYSLFHTMQTHYTARGVFPKPYFYASLVGYIMGLLTTLVAMQLSDHPQPALLYLVPSVLSSLWLTACLKRELHQMWWFSDAVEELEDATGTGEEKKLADGNEKEISKQENAQESQSKSTSSRSSFFSLSNSERRAKRIETALSSKITDRQEEGEGSDLEVHEGSSMQEGENEVEVDSGDSARKSTRKEYTLMSFYVRKVVSLSIAIASFEKSSIEDGGKEGSSSGGSEHDETKDQQRSPREKDEKVDGAN